MFIFFVLFVWGKKARKAFEIEKDDTDEEDPDFTVVASDVLQVRAVLSVADVNIHRTLKGMDHDSITKFSEKIQLQKNSDRLIEIVAKNLPELMILEANNNYIFYIIIDVFWLLSRGVGKILCLYFTFQI